MRLRPINAGAPPPARQPVRATVESAPQICSHCALAALSGGSHEGESRGCRDAGRAAWRSSAGRRAGAPRDLAGSRQGADGGQGPQRRPTQYDFVEANQRNGDGSVSTDVLVNPAEKAALAAEGVQFLGTLEDASDTAAVAAQRDEAQVDESIAQDLAEHGAAAKGAQSAVPLPGEVTIMRAYTFTNYAGRFLYVEAHSKAVTGPPPAGAPQSSPTMALTYAGADGVFGTATNMSINRDTQTGIPANEVY